MLLDWQIEANEKARRKYVGMVVETKRDGRCTIIDYTGRDKMLAEFEDGTVVSTSVSQVGRGSIRNPMKPAVYGVGFGGIGPYNSSNSRVAWHKWGNMLERCYCPKYLTRKPSYVGCSVDTYWLNFQNFARWFNDQPFFERGWHLDKDLIIKGNRVYRPEACSLVPSEVNMLTVNSSNDRAAFERAVIDWSGKIDQRVISALEVWFE